MIKEVLAVIPARGGSKGIPRKNLRELGGKPLIAHTIAATRAAMHVNRVVVSTDDAEIAAVARAHGAEVVERPVDLSGDHASSEAALLHVLQHLADTDGYAPDLLLFLQCTSPFTTANDVDGIVEALIKQRADSALTVAPAHQFLWRVAPDGSAEGINHVAARRHRRQDRDPEFVETGSIYAMRVPGFLEARHRFFGRTILFETAAENYLELDEPSDLIRAEERFRSLRRQRASELPMPVAGIVMDFDGVLSDDRVITGREGQESVISSRSDGMGIERLRHAAIPMVVISKEVDMVGAARCRKLQLPIHHGIENKLALFEQWIAEQGLDADRVIYVGNDINDVECLSRAGCGVVPRDAHPAALAVADLVLEADGGRGAIRLLSDMVLADLG